MADSLALWPLECVVVAAVAGKVAVAADSAKAVIVEAVVLAAVVVSAACGRLVVAMHRFLRMWFIALPLAPLHLTMQLSYCHTKEIT